MHRTHSIQVFTCHRVPGIQQVPNQCSFHEQWLLWESLVYLGNAHWLSLLLMLWLLCHWDGRPTGVQTSHSVSEASALGLCQIPVSRLWPFPDRAKYWPLAKSPRVKPEREARLSRVCGLPLSLRHPRSLDIPSGWCPDTSPGGCIVLCFPENRGQSHSRLAC
jgi:hypothetical protein